MKKSVLLLIAAAVVSSVIVFALRRTQGPKAATRPTLDSTINVHGSPEQGLRICGKTFRRVKGVPPYYIPVPNMPLVLLAYEPDHGKNTLVVCNTNDCTFLQIPLGEAVFGNQIGYWEATKGQMGDTVESASSNRLALLSKGFRYIERSLLDLTNGSLRVVEVRSDLNSLDFDPPRKQPSQPETSK